jgi:hypothetical protein
VPRLRVGQDDVRFELRGVRCGLPTNRPEPAIYLQPVWKSASTCSRQLRSEVAEGRTLRQFDCKCRHNSRNGKGNQSRGLPY